MLGRTEWIAGYTRGVNLFVGAVSNASGGVRGANS